jgi:allantoinase
MDIAELAIVNGRVVTPSGTSDVDISIKQGRIHSLVERGTEIQATEYIDAAGAFVLPGAIDIHFHCRGRAYPERGDFSTETRAAGSAGVTTVFEMPISKPATSTLSTWTERRKEVEQDAYVNVGLYAGPARLDPNEIHAMADAGAIGFKLFLSRAPAGREDEFDGLVAADAATVYRALELVANTGLRTVFHAEEDTLLELFMERAKSSGRSDYRLHLDSRPSVVEATAIAIVCAIALELDAAAHIAHLSSRQGVELIRDARARGCHKLTAETCPHYLLFTNDVLEQVGAFGKINPPMRELQDQQALWQGLDDGTIDVIATDHAPFTVTEKDVPMENILSAPPGHPGVEILVPFAMTQAICGKISIAKAVELISARPAKLFDLYPKKGAILPGSDADLVIYDPSQWKTVQRDQWLSKTADSNRLYDGWNAQGQVLTTILNGKVIYCDGEFLGERGAGQLVRPAH